MKTFTIKTMRAKATLPLSAQMDRTVARRRTLLCMAVGIFSAFPAGRCGGAITDVTMTRIVDTYLYYPEQSYGYSRDNETAADYETGYTGRSRASTTALGDFNYDAATHVQREQSWSTLFQNSPPQSGYYDGITSSHALMSSTFSSTEDQLHLGVYGTVHLSRSAIQGGMPLATSWINYLFAIAVVDLKFTLTAPEDIHLSFNDSKVGDFLRNQPYFADYDSDYPGWLGTDANNGIVLTGPESLRFESNVSGPNIGIIKDISMAPAGDYELRASLITAYYDEDAVTGLSLGIGDMNIHLDVIPTPEPASAALLLGGGALLALRRRR